MPSRKRQNYKRDFKAWGDDEIADLQDFLTDPQMFQEAQLEMRKLRQQI